MSPIAASARMAAPSTMLRMVPLPRHTGEEPAPCPDRAADAPPFTGELSAQPTEGAPYVPFTGREAC
jgi:hypothetical protein